MCGRYTATAAQEVIEDYFGAEFSETHIPVFNSSPGQHLPVVLNVAPGKIQRALSGIKPEWKDQPSRLLINARAETVNQRPTFRESFRQRRCLVIADGFYDGKATKEGKQPIHDRMPVILEQGGTGVLWLDHELPAEAVLKLLAPYRDDAMTAYRVSKAVNDSRNEREEVIEPVA